MMMFLLTNRTLVTNVCNKYMSSHRSAFSAFNLMVVLLHSGYSTFMMMLSVAFTYLGRGAGRRLQNIDPTRPGEGSEGPPPHFFETPCSLITVVLIGRLLEAAAKQRTTESLDELVRASPPTAKFVNGEELPTELVPRGGMMCQSWIFNAYQPML